MNFKPIKRRHRLYQDIIQQIHDAILEGRIKPGERLPSERNLAAFFQVSRQSVKEAITVLESHGMITTRPGVGMFLNEFSEKELLLRFAKILEENHQLDFLHLYELRQAIEVDAAYYAAQRITDEQKQLLERVYSELKNKTEQGLIAFEEDYLFHYTIIEASNNPLMLEVMDLIADKIFLSVKKIREHSLKNIYFNRAVMKEHEHIFRAIMDQDAEKAKDAMWQHHLGIKRRHKELLERGGGEVAN